ncbi:GntR family transcriptional regulator, partial [[Clostridium] innocuum]|nr:GntR family transcriptional regulator [[Clostridium] innocuum]
MKESKPKYLEIADAIHQEIRQEIYKQGDKLPVERELQERFGAS